MTVSSMNGTIALTSAGVRRRGPSTPPGGEEAEGGRVEAAEDDGLVDERDHRLDLGRGQEAGALHTPGRRGGDPALQLLEPFRRPGDLDAAALVVDTEVAVLVGAVEREGRHLLGVVGQEDEVRGMAGGAAGVREGALLDEQDLLPALLRQVPGHAVADDPGPDDDDLRALRQRCHDSLASSARPRDTRATPASGWAGGVDDDGL